jgi:hypothetical protein
MTPSYDELRLILQSIEALKQRTINDLDALAAQVVLFLPREEAARGREFRRYTSKDWERFLEGSGDDRRPHRHSSRLKLIA